MGLTDNRHSLFTAAATTTVSYGWWPGVPTPAEETHESRNQIVGRAHSLWQNTAIVRAIINRLVDSTVGTGLRLQSQPDATILEKKLGLDKKKLQEWTADTEARFRAYWESTQISLCGTMTSADQAHMLLTNVLVSGDSGIRYVRQRGVDGSALKTQVIDSMRFESPWDKANDPNVIAGVEVDPATGTPTAYYINTAKANSSYDPESIGRPTRFKRIENGTLATDLVFIHQRPNQYRGLSLLTPVVEASKQLHDLMGAGIRGEHVRSTIAFAVQAEDPTETVKDLDGNVAALKDRGAEEKPPPGLYYKENTTLLAEGKVLKLRKGDKLIPLQNPNLSGSLKELTDLLVTTIGAAAGVPKEILMQVYTTSFTSARAAQLNMDTQTRGLRKHLANWYCSPVYEMWLETQVAAGKIEAPGFFLDPDVRAAWLSHEFTGDTLGHMDPVKMVNFYVAAVNSGFCSIERAMSELFGADFSTESDRIAAEHKAMKDKGIDCLVAPLQAKQAADDKEKDKDKEDDDKEKDDA